VLSPAQIRFFDDVVSGKIDIEKLKYEKEDGRTLY
jgi:hypothetical protein